MSEVSRCDVCGKYVYPLRRAMIKLKDWPVREEYFLCLDCTEKGEGGELVIEGKKIKLTLGGSHDQSTTDR